MGLPDFLKFVARAAPGALCRLPKPAGDGTVESPDAVTGSMALLEFDYVLIDSTNASQTIGLERVYEFLCSSRLVVRKAVIFALDAQRSREGTARHHRQPYTLISDLDVRVQKMCSSLNDHYRQRALARAAARSAARGKAGHQIAGAREPLSVPYVLMSGRDVAGEADYKMLDLQRCIVARAMAQHEVELPRFLFVSEDSDILCGALCGPAPQNVCIATNLRDTLFELSLLRLDQVLAYVAVCVDALVNDAGADDGAVARAEEEKEATRVAAEEVELSAARAQPSDSKPAHAEQIDETPSSPPAENDVVRRRKQDGPMVAAGKHTKLDDSSSSDDSDADEETNGVSKAQPTQHHETTRPATGGAAAGKANGSVKEDASRVSVDSPTPFALTSARMVQSSCIDLVFLFVVVMGNGVNVPPLVRGVTKVDIASCWQAYCKHKFAAQGTLGMSGFMTQEESQLGRALLSTTQTGKGDGAGTRASLSLNARYLLSVLESVHYADAQSRPPVEEEKDRAMAYLSNAVYATLRYIVACNIHTGAALQETFLDSRPLAETEVLAPSLAAVLWVLGQESSLPFSFPLQGLAKKELLALAGVNDTSASDVGDRQTLGMLKNASTAPPHAAAATDSTEHGRSGRAGSTLTLDVTEALVCPAGATAIASSWAVSGGGSMRRAGVGSSHVYTLAHILTHDNSIVTGPGGRLSGTAPMRGGTPLRSGAVSEVASAAGRAGVPAMRPGASVGALVRAFCPAARGLFPALCEAWRHSVAMAVPRLQCLARQSRFTSPVTGNVVEGPLAITESRAAGLKAPVAAAAPPQRRLSRAAGDSDSTTKLVYSFELRRMTPLLTTGDADAHAGTDEAEGTGSPAAGRPQSAQAALQAALGLSFDYAVAPQIPKGVVVSEGTKPRPAHKRKRDEAKTTARGARAEVAAASADGETQKKKYRRPGKNERKRRLQSGASPAKGQSR